MSSSKEKLATVASSSHHSSHHGRLVDLELASFCVFHSMGQKEGEVSAENSDICCMILANDALFGVCFAGAQENYPIFPCQHGNWRASSDRGPLGSGHEIRQVCHGVMVKELGLIVGGFLENFTERRNINKSINRSIKRTNVRIKVFKSINQSMAWYGCCPLTLQILCTGSFDP